MTLIYHITHISNLPGILSGGGLYCDAEMMRRGVNVQCIAYGELKQRRARTEVPVSPGGTLADYVPFYFCNRSPMMFAIHTNSVKNYCGGQDELVYLVSSVESVMEKGLPFCFTDGHAVEAITSFFKDIGELRNIDWEIVGHWSWKKTPDDLDRKRRKQAEFLVHGFFPWELVDRIGVFDSDMKENVTNIVKGHTHIPMITVEKKWYY